MLASNSGTTGASSRTPVSWMVRKMRTLSAMLLGMLVATSGVLVAGLTGNGDRRVVTDHLGCHLNNGLRYHRIDLARHDRRPGLQGRQFDLT